MTDSEKLKLCEGLLKRIKETGGEDCGCNQVGPCGCGNSCSNLAEEALDIINTLTCITCEKPFVSEGSLGYVCLSCELDERFG